MDRLSAALGGGYGAAVLFLDLDHFKVINDSMGHVAGDELLVAVARRLTECVRPGDTIARLGGDEFMILLEGLPRLRQAARIAERIIQALKRPYLISGREVSISTSVGIAAHTSGYASPDDLMRRADIALYHAKASGRSVFAIFDERMNAAALKRLELENELRAAIEGGQLIVYYQPILDLRTGSVEGLEALVRWQHPRRGLVQPAEFIPLAEETGLILPLGRQVLFEACRHAARLQPANDKPPVMSVNLSARQFAQPDLVQQVRSALDETGLAPERLKLEITESVAMADLERSVAVLQTLRRLGVRLAIDDFGTGYSSLSYLKQLPIDTVKLDRSFIEPLGDAPSDAAIVRAVVELSNALGLSVTAEGIETQQQLAVLRSLGCASGQGYYLGRPAPPDAIPVLNVPSTLQPLAA
jgi:diguanylate cyclase (GGDEF)-like protein